MKNKMTQRCRLMCVQAARHNKFDKFGHFAQAKLRFGFSLKVISTQWRPFQLRSFRFQSNQIHTQMLNYCTGQLFAGEFHCHAVI